MSMDLISSCNRKRIIDVGAGATTLIDTLVENGYDVTVLDISTEALRILSNRHGTNLQYINGDLSKELELGQFEIWHDRAVLHFLLNQEDRERYISNLESCIPSGGFAVIETFSIDTIKQLIRVILDLNIMVIHGDVPWVVRKIISIYIGAVIVYPPPFYTNLPLTSFISVRDYLKIYREKVMR